MTAPPTPPDEADRISALRELGVLDTPPEERFDRITRLATRMFRVPIALVSLVDVNRQWFKSCQGLGVSETGREVSFCGHAILEGGIMVIPDARKDPRFCDNPIVTGPPHVLFYAGHVLKGPRGRKMGTLCLIDHGPREFDGEDRKLLRDLAAIAERELNLAEVGHLQKELLATTTLQKAILDSANHTIISTDAEGVIQSFNHTAERMLGHGAEDLIGKETPGIFHDAEEVRARAVVLSDELGERVEPGFEVFVAKARRGQPDENEWTYIRKDGSRFPVSLSVTAIRDEAGAVTGFLGIGYDITERKAAEKELASALEGQSNLLLNILPGSIAERLGKSESVIADRLPEVTILFADLHDFSRLTQGLPATEVVKKLNEIVSCFDALVDRMGLEKIKTVGNAYMAAGGAPEPRPDHAEAVADLALAMQREIVKMTAPNGESFVLRVGVNTGPVVAGVIGKSKFTYDLWGETVATAWEMAALGSPGNIQVNESTEAKLRDKYIFEARGDYYIKDKGTVHISFLKGKKRAAP